eukprot:CAMPEP_0170558282 /NCGR_PEP_ID=MMETSP0211-20121228/34185_1 /TAXON_ID=311385 /ORGANISM="Pseudokeronopsis sp., Strain OXSARD2" /LENGTH=31 /DNA_ID= /DNA_START= /DNA_END= /DNA_ORIENTATION=
MTGGSDVTYKCDLNPSITKNEVKELEREFAE